MEKESFEDKLKSAFDDAEIAPSEGVWTNLELKLAREEAAAMRQRLVFFKMLAAASVVIALSVGGYSLYYFNFKFEQQGIAAVAPKTDVPVKTPGEEKASLPIANNQNASATSLDQDQSKVNISQSAPAAFDLNKDTYVSNHYQTTQAPALAESNNSASNEVGRSQVVGASPSAFMLDKSRLSGIAPQVSLQAAPWRSNVKQQDPVEVMMQRLADRERQLAAVETKKSAEKEKNNNEDLWTSLGFAAGTFNATGSTGVAATAAPATLSAATAPVDKEAKASGQAYSLGVNIGKKLADRWVLQGGVSYLTQLSDYTAQAAITSSDFQSFRPVSTNELEKMNQADAPANAKVVSTAPYNVNNNVKYLSVPVQAGYLLINRKFGLQFNAGVATDIFLQNSKTADGENIEKISEHIGEESPYRPMNFSGLMGTEFSYKFGDRYRLALNPGVRYPINSIYKSSLNVQANPITFDIGLRFRYIFQ